MKVTNFFNHNNDLSYFEDLEQKDTRRQKWDKTTNRLYQKRGASNVWSPFEKWSESLFSGLLFWGLCLCYVSSIKPGFRPIQDPARPRGPGGRARTLNRRKFNFVMLPIASIHFLSWLTLAGWRFLKIYRPFTCVPP